MNNTMSIPALATITDATTLFKLLSDPTRFRIICTLLRIDPDDDMCVYEIADAVQITQSAASHQLAKLESHDVIVGRRDGQTICYQISDSTVAETVRSLMQPFI